MARQNKTYHAQSGGDFLLPGGIDIPDISALKNAYTLKGGGNYEALLSADRLAGFIADFTELLPEPIFFFLELPLTDSEEKEHFKGGDGGHYRLYYLDNCTRPVIRAILKDYGSLLINDGVCRFGFGGNESGDEIYIRSYKVISLYASGQKLCGSAERLFGKYGAQKSEQLITPWDILTEDNESICVSAEEDGISLFDLPLMLKPAGIYFSSFF